MGKVNATYSISCFYAIMIPIYLGIQVILMVNEKMYELGSKKSTIRTIFEYGQKRAKEVGAENICDFSLGNPNVPAPDYIKEAVLDIFLQH